MKNKILITGATGLVGKALTSFFLNEGFEVNILVRKNKPIANGTPFIWDVENEYIDPLCLEGVDTIIHLAGASIGTESWSESRKKEIINSRVKSTQLIHELLQKTPNKVKNYIGASAVGYYGSNNQEILTEDKAPGQDFLAYCCVKWEEAHQQIIELNLNVSILRFGIVLDKNGGSLPQMAMPIKVGFGAPLANGDQWVSWIHLQDLILLISHFIKNPNLNGVFNATAPNPVTNKTLTLALGKTLKRWIWPIHVPKFMLKIILGERIELILSSQNCSAKKIIESGFNFKFPNITLALYDIYRKN